MRLRRRTTGNPLATDPDTRGPLRLIWWAVRCQPRRVALASAYGSLWMISLTIWPYLVSQAIDQGLRPEDFSALISWSLAILVVGILNALLAIARHRTMSKVRMEANFGISRVVIRQATLLGSELSRRLHSGEMAAVGLGDVGAVSTSLTVTGPGVGAVVAYAVVTVLLFLISPTVAWPVVIGMPIICIVVGPFLSRLLAVQSSYRNQQGVLSTQLVDIVGGLRILNAFGGKETYGNRYRAASGEALRRGVRVSSVTSWITSLGVGLPSIFLAIVTWVAARQTSAGEMTVGDLVAVYGYMTVLVMPISTLIEGGDQLSRGVASARRIIAFLVLRAAPVSESTTKGPAVPSRLYDPDSGASIEPGEFVALVAEESSDSLAILERLAALAPCRTEWGTERLTRVFADEIRERILLADHDAMIFSGTIRSVVSAGRELSDHDVLNALRAAAAEDILTLFEDGLDGMVAAGGNNLSGGQRERLRLARALARQPEVLLASEPTSALDAFTESLVAERFARFRIGKQTMIATRSPLMLTRLSTIHYVVRGQVVSTGTHHDLLENRGYRRLVARDLDAQTNGRS